MAFESRAVKAESVIAAVKLVIGESEDAKQSDDELHLRVRAYVDRKTRRADAALADALEEAQLLRSKAKQMGQSRVTDAASVDDRVLKLAEIRDKLVEEMNAQSAELERADAEIESRAAAVAAARDEITDLELKLASSNAQNARLIEIIEEQGRWSAAEPSSSVSAPRAAVSAPVTPVKSAPRRVDARRRDVLAASLGDRKALLARIEARLLEIHALHRH
jgi:chromosome segregation ATPase